MLRVGLHGSALVLFLAACGTRRTYPMVDFHAESTGGPLQWSGAVLTTADVAGRGIHIIGGEFDALGTWNVAPILDLSLTGQFFYGSGAWSDLTPINRLQLGGYGQLELTL